MNQTNPVYEDASEPDEAKTLYVVACSQSTPKLMRHAILPRIKKFGIPTIWAQGFELTSNRAYMILQFSSTEECDKVIEDLNLRNFLDIGLVHATFWAKLNAFKGNKYQVDYIPADYSEREFIQETSRIKDVITYRTLWIKKEKKGNKVQCAVITFKTSKAGEDFAKHNGSELRKGLHSLVIKKMPCPDIYDQQKRAPKEFKTAWVLLKMKFWTEYQDLTIWNEVPKKGNIDVTHALSTQASSSTIAEEIPEDGEDSEYQPSVEFITRFRNMEIYLNYLYDFGCIPKNVDRVIASQIRYLLGAIVSERTSIQNITEKMMKFPKMELMKYMSDPEHFEKKALALKTCF